MELKLSKTQRKHAKKYLDTVTALRDEIMGADDFSYHHELITYVLMVLSTFDRSIDMQTQAYIGSFLLGVDNESKMIMEGVEQGKEYVRLLDKYAYTLLRARSRLIDLAENPGWEILRYSHDYLLDRYGDDKKIDNSVLLEEGTAYWAREIVEEIDTLPDDEEIAQAIGRDAKQS